MDNRLQNSEKEQKESIIRTVARFIKYNKILVLFSLILSVLIIFTIFGNKGLIRKIRLESELKHYEEILNKEKEKSKEYKETIDSLQNSDEKIERVAREKYGMTKEGETIYFIKVDSSESK